MFLAAIVMRWIDYLIVQKEPVPGENNNFSSIFMGPTQMVLILEMVYPMTKIVPQATPPHELSTMNCGSKNFVGRLWAAEGGR